MSIFWSTNKLVNVFWEHEPFPSDINIMDLGKGRCILAALILVSGCSLLTPKPLTGKAADNLLPHLGDLGRTLPGAQLTFS